MAPNASAAFSSSATTQRPLAGLLRENNDSNCSLDGKQAFESSLTFQHDLQSPTKQYSDRDCVQVVIGADWILLALSCNNRCFLLTIRVCTVVVVYTGVQVECNRGIW